MASQGFGCMGFSAFYSSSRRVSEEDKIKTFRHVVSKGVTLFNTATFYGPLHKDGFGTNLRFIRSALEGIDRSKIQLMVKIGMDTKAEIDKQGTRWFLSGKEEFLLADLDYALQELGTDCIDIAVICRVPTDVTAVELGTTLAKFVQSGKCKYVGLSEASADYIRQVHAIHPVYCIEQEYSLWSRDIEEEIIPTCRELGIKIMAYSPLGRGALTGTISGKNDEKLDPYDYRVLASPKFSEENYKNNLTLIEEAKKLAEKNDITVGQLSLAWLHSKGNDIIPIPGTTSIGKIPILLFIKK